MTRGGVSVGDEVVVLRNGKECGRFRVRDYFESVDQTLMIYESVEDQNIVGSEKPLSVTVSSEEIDENILEPGAYLLLESLEDPSKKAGQ